MSPAGAACRSRRLPQSGGRGTPDLPTDIMDFGGFDSSIILIVRGGIPRPTGDSPESLSQAILVGIMLVGKSGVGHAPPSHLD